MTLFPKMDDDTPDKDVKTDPATAPGPNTTGTADTDREEEYRVLQLFRDIIARFTNEDEKTNKEEEMNGVVVQPPVDEEFDANGMPSRMNSPVPTYGMTGNFVDEHKPVGDGKWEDGGKTGDGDTITNSADDGNVSLVCFILNASIMQLIFGIICIALGVASAVVRIPTYHIGDPIWTGIFFYVATALVGLCTWRFPKDGLVVSYLVMSILSAFASFQLMALVAFAVRMENVFDDTGRSAEERIRYELYVQQITASNDDGFSKSERLALELLIFFVAFIELVFVIVMTLVTCAIWSRPIKNERKKDNTLSDQNDEHGLKEVSTEKSALD